MMSLKSLLIRKRLLSQSPEKFKIGKEDGLSKTACDPQFGNLEELKDLCEYQYKFY